MLAAWSTADLYPDAAPALRRLHGAGVKLAALTNGSDGQLSFLCSHTGSWLCWSAQCAACMLQAWRCRCLIAY